MHPYFFYLWLEWSDRLKLATPDCKKSNEASATQGIGARSSQFGRTCKEVGAMRQYVQSHAQDELLKSYRREYMRRFAWIRVGKI